jgi:hypothetical protein
MDTAHLENSWNTVITGNVAHTNKSDDFPWDVPRVSFRFRCSSRSSVSPGTLGARPCLSINAAQQWDPWVPTIVQPSPGIKLVQEWSITQQWPQITLVQQRATWCGLKNTYGMSVYSKEYNFPILFIFSVYFFLLFVLSLFLFLFSVSLSVFLSPFSFTPSLTKGWLSYFSRSLQFRQAATHMGSQRCRVSVTRISSERAPQPVKIRVTFFWRYKS